MSENKPVTMTVAEICRDYQISRYTVHRLQKARRLPQPYKLGNAIRFPRAETVKAFERMRGQRV